MRTDPDYDRIRDTVLAPLGLTEAQVQVAWIKQANPGPTASLPSASADAYTLEMQLGNTVRAAKQRWPNLKIVFLSSRIYAGYATSTLRRQQRPPVLNVQDFGCLLMRYAGGCN